MYVHTVWHKYDKALSYLCTSYDQAVLTKTCLTIYSYDIALSYLLKSAQLLKIVTSSILSNPCNAKTMRIIYLQKNSKLK